MRRPHDWSNTIDCHCRACGLPCPVHIALADSRFDSRTGVWADGVLPPEYVTPPCKARPHLQVAS